MDGWMQWDRTTPNAGADTDRSAAGWSIPAGYWRDAFFVWQSSGGNRSLKIEVEGSPIPPTLSIADPPLFNGEVIEGSSDRNDKANSFYVNLNAPPLGGKGSVIYKTCVSSDSTATLGNTRLSGEQDDYIIYLYNKNQIAGNLYQSRNCVTYHRHAQVEDRFAAKIRGDTIDEPDETVVLSISKEPGSANVLLGQSRATLTIKDDDPTIVSLTRAQGNTGGLIEGDPEKGKAEFTVTLGRPLVAGERIDVPIMLSGLRRVDYTLTTKSGDGLNTGVSISPGPTSKSPYYSEPRTISFQGAGAQTATLEITTLENNKPDNDETLYVALRGNSYFDADSDTNVGGGADPSETANNFSVRVFDAGVTIKESDDGISVTEQPGAGHTDSYTVVLDSRPRADVTIAVESGDTGAATVSPATLTFTPSNWNTAQTVTVTGVHDNVDQGGNHTAIITHTATSSDAIYNIASIPDVTVTVVDDDTMGVIIKESDDATSVTEEVGAGRTDLYTVMLDSRPTADVTIAVESGDTGAATVSPTTLTFTASNWNTGQTVKVTGVDDDVDQLSDRSVTITHTATSKDDSYNTISIPDITATVVDDDIMGVTVTESNGSTQVTEASGTGRTDSYTVALDIQPSTNVEIKVRSRAPAAATVSPATLTFTPSNWNTGQTVTVTGVDDSVDQNGNRSITITHHYHNYRGAAIPHLSAIVVDDDTGGAAVINICDRTPLIEAKILESLSKTQADCGSLTPAELAQVKTLKLSNPTVKDGDLDDLTGLGKFHLTCNGNGLRNLPSNVFDDLTNLRNLYLGDCNGLRSLPSGVFDNLTDLRELAVYSGSLRSLPSGVFDNLTNLTSLLLFENNLTSLPSGMFDNLTNLTRLWLFENNLTSLPSGVFDNLTNLTTLSLHDNNLTSLQSGVFKNLTSLTNLSLQRNNLICLPSIPSSVSVGLQLDRRAYPPCGDGVTLKQLNDATSVTEAPGEGRTDRYTMVLEAKPTASVTVVVTSSAPAAATVRPAILTFTTINWNTAQTVTVTGVDDGVDQKSDRSATISHSATSTDPNYNNIAIPNITATVVDDDTMGVTITESDNVTSMTEGQADHYMVVLDSQPEGNVTIMVTSDMRTVVTMSPGTLTFTITNWNMAQTVTVTGIDDSLDQSSDRSATISHSATSTDPDYNNIAIPHVTATVVDDDTMGVTIEESDGSTSVTEASGLGRTDHYTVVLDSKPKGNVTITVTSDMGTVATVSPATLTFTPSKWNTTQTVTVTGVDDGRDQSSDRSATISHSATSTDSDYNNITIPHVTATVVDDDTVGVTIEESDGSTSVSEASGPGRTDHYTVVLDALPTSHVKIKVQSGAPAAATVSPATLTFTRSNWNTTQTVTVTGVDDNVDQSGNRSIIITHDRIIDRYNYKHNYRNVTIPNVMAMVVDDDTGGQTVINICDRTAQVEKAILNTLGKTQADCGSITPAELAGIDYLNIRSIAALKDGDLDDLTGLDSLYLGGLWRVSSGVFDDLTSLIYLDLDKNNLSSLPSGVFDKLTSLQGLDLRKNNLRKLSSGLFDNLKSLQSLHLGANNLSSLPSRMFDKLTSLQYLYLYHNNLTSLPSGVFDNLTRMKKLHLRFNNLICLPSIPSSVTTLDLDKARGAYPACGAGVTINQSDDAASVTEAPGEGRTDRYTMVLDTRPTGDVTITITSDKTAAVTVSPAALTFTTANWTTAQTVTVTGVDDKVDQSSDLSATISHTVTSSDPNYNNIPIDHVTATVVDDDGAGVTIEESADGTTVTEAPGEGRADTYTVVLDSQPTGDVTITINSDTTTAVTVSPAPLTFTTSNWTTAQTVTVTGVDDKVDQGNNRNATISHTVTSSDPNYNNIPIDHVTATVVDDDGAGVTIEESADGTTVTEAPGEGRADTYTVVLDSQPTGDVTITINSDTTTAVTVSPAPLTFTTSNWNTGQTVTVTGVVVDDKVDQSDNRGITISHSATSRDAQYNNIAIDHVIAMVMDDDGAGVTIEESADGTTVTEAPGEGRADTYTVVLDSQPTGDVTITINSDTTTAVTVSPAPLTFTTSNWNTGQTVTVTGVVVDDKVDQSDNRGITISHSATSRDAQYNNIAIDHVIAMVMDDDEAGVTINQSDDVTSVTEAPGEGHTDTYVLVLDSQPTATVSIVVISDTPAAAMVSPAILTFTTSNWNTGQTVTVTGVDDKVDQSSDRSATISHTAISSDGNYGNIPIDPVTAIVVDDHHTAAPEMRLSVSNDGAATEGGALTITVSSSAVNTSGWALSVPIQVRSAGTTAQSDDYTLSSSILIPDGATTGTTTFTVNDDNVDELVETVVVELATVPTDAMTGANSGEVTITIVDNDATTVTLAAPDANDLAEQNWITEENGRMKFTIALSRPLVEGETALVPYTVTGGNVNDHWNIRSITPSGGPVERIGSGAKAAVKFTEGGQRATLMLVGRPDSDTMDRSITIAFGTDKRAPSGNVEGGIQPVGGPLTVTIIDDDVSAEPGGLTVSLAAEQSSITENNGKTKFTIALSRPLVEGETVVAPYTVTGGDVNDHWNIWNITPSGGPVERIGNGAKAAVKFTAGGQRATLMLVGRPDSDTVDRTITIAFDTGQRAPRSSNVDGGIQPVGGSLTVTIIDSHAPALWVKDRTAEEDEGLLRFTIQLSTPSQQPVSVSYRTRESDPVSAREGQDYRASSGRLTFQPGKTRKQVAITIYDDSHDEGLETFQLVLSNAQGARIADGVGVGAILNTDPLPAAWLVRFGRTVSQQVMDALQGRLTARPAAGLQLTVAGEDFTDATSLAEHEGVLSKVLGFETVTPQELVEGSSFSVAPEGEAGVPQLGLWGQGVLSSFSGQEEGVSSLNGDVTTALLGVDWTGQRWQAGAALSQSWGHGSYGGDHGADGQITTTLTGVFPYGRMATPRLGLWAVAGYGWGQLSLKPDGTEDEIKPSTTMTMAAVGMDGVLLDGGSEGITLSSTADVLTLKTNSEEVEGLESSESSVSRLRVGLEATRPFPLSNGASLLPSMEMGIRQDGGDAETGYGLDLGAGILWSDPERGIVVNLRGRTLLTHTEEEFQEQGLSLSFSWEPNPSNRGPSLSMGHTMGAAATGGMDALLNPITMEGLDAVPSSGQQFEAELAYGFSVYNDRLTLTPAVVLALSPTSKNYSLLWSLAPYADQLQGEPWELSLAGERQEQVSSPSSADHSLKLTFSALF